MIFTFQKSRNGTESPRDPCLAILHNEGTMIKTKKLTLGQYYCPGVRKLGSQAIASPLPSFVFKVLLEYSHAHSFTCCLSFQLQ